MHAAAPVSCALFALLSVLPPGETAVPGTFFWKPRVSLDLDLPDRNVTGIKPTLQNIRKGLVVGIEGYQLGLTVAALLHFMQHVNEAFPHLHPGMAPYYTNAYRWALRHLDLIPNWLVGKRFNYLTTHKVWRRRFFFMNSFVPQWMRNILFYVDDKSWKYEEWEYKKFLKHAETHFGKYYHYPSLNFNDHRSMRQDLTVEHRNQSDNSITYYRG